MKRLLSIFVCLLVLCGLIGCKTKKMVTESVTSERTDTTKFITDNIEFTDSGGTLTIDTLGNLKADGVKSYQHGKKAAQTRAESITQSKDSTDTHKLQANAVQSKDNKQAKQPQKQGVKALKWYQRTIYHIGFLCCVAAIIYSILLYLRRKK